MMRTLNGFALLMTVMLAAACQLKTPATPSPPPPEPVVHDPVTVPQPSFARITVLTNPPGGSVRIAETNQTLAVGDSVNLTAGHYTFHASKKGYRDATISLDVDGRTSRTVKIPLGEGYADVSIQSTPPGAAVAINGTPKGTAPLELELLEGDYKVAFQRNGYIGAMKAITVRPGIPVHVAVSLNPIPTQGAATVTTQPEGGEIYLEDRMAGTGRVELGPLSFGAYPLHGVKPEGETMRRVGDLLLEIRGPEPVTATLVLDRRERLFEGRWMDEKEALAAEERRYEAQRVANPIEITSDLTEEQYRKLSAINDLDRCLQAVLRVGDRVRFTAGGNVWTIWKRDEGMTPEFQETVRSFQREAPCSDLWAADPPSARLSVPPSAKEVLGAIAMVLHRGRTEAPLLDLGYRQLEKDGETVRRSPADGSLTMVIDGGEGVGATGVSLETYGALSIAAIPAAGSPLQVKWKKPPRRLLVVSDRPGRLKNPSKDAVLMAREKQIVSLAEDVGVTEVVRFSSGPDFDGWQRRAFNAEGPLATQIDLRRDEIGPNEKPGDYRRTWIVRYDDGSGATQRQVDTAYRVEDVIKDFSGERFIRRSAMEHNGSE